MDEELIAAIRAREAREHRTKTRFSRLDFLKYYGVNCLECGRQFEWPNRRPSLEAECIHVKCRDCFTSTDNDGGCYQCQPRFYMEEEYSNIITEPCAEEVEVETDETYGEETSGSQNGVSRDEYEEPRVEVTQQPLSPPMKQNKVPDPATVAVENTICISAIRAFRMEQGNPEMCITKEELKGNRNNVNIVHRRQYDQDQDFYITTDSANRETYAVQKIQDGDGEVEEVPRYYVGVSDEEILRYFNGQIPYIVEPDILMVAEDRSPEPSVEGQSGILDIHKEINRNDNHSVQLRSHSPRNNVTQLPNNQPSNLVSGCENEKIKLNTNKGSFPTISKSTQAMDNILRDAFVRKSESSEMNKATVVPLPTHMPEETKAHQTFPAASYVEIKTPMDILLDLTSKKRKPDYIATDDNPKQSPKQSFQNSEHEAPDDQCDSPVSPAPVSNSVPILISKMSDNGGLVIQKIVAEAIKQKVNPIAEIANGSGKPETSTMANPGFKRLNFLPVNFPAASLGKKDKKTAEIEASTLMIARRNAGKPSFVSLKSDVGLNLCLIKPREGEQKPYGGSKTETPEGQLQNETSGLVSLISHAAAATAAAISNSSSSVQSTNREPSAKPNENLKTTNTDYIPNDGEIPSTSTSSASSATKQVRDKRPFRKRAPVSIPYINVITQKDKSGLKTQVIYECTKCNKKFKTRAHIEYHKYCGGEEKPYQCKEEGCGKTCIAKSHFQYHERTHSGERPYVCPECGRGFNATGKLTRHKRTHTGEKPFECVSPGCGKKFSNSQALKAHILVHTGERPFTCIFCDKKFNVMTNLKKHLLVHTGERNFGCEVCGKRFGLKWTLDIHMRSHSALRPYACEVCTRAFTNSKDLRRHKLIHSPERKFFCSICQTTFRRKDNCDRHMRQVHRVAPKRGEGTKLVGPAEKKN